VAQPDPAERASAIYSRGRANREPRNIATAPRVWGRIPLKKEKNWIVIYYLEKYCAIFKLYFSELRKEGRKKLGRKLAKRRK
jgi:hypothetical protein